MLSHETFPATTTADKSPLIIVHGLFGSGRNWGAIARRLADRREVWTVDQRNHGTSPRAPSQTYPDMAADLAEVVHAAGGNVDLLGHSMGGKAAMQLALTQPHLIRKLVVADIAPVAYRHDNTQHVHAMRGLDLTGLTSRGEADRRLSEVESDPALRAFFLQSLDLKSDPPRWRLNLDVLEAEMATIVGWPDTPGVFNHPTLFLSGENSRYVLPEHRAAILAQFPKARFAKINDAGHWLHAEQPRAFEDTVRVFLDA
jgi:esterase